MNEIAHSRNVRIGHRSSLHRIDAHVDASARGLVRPSLTMFIQSLIEKATHSRPSPPAIGRRGQTPVARATDLRP